jgi:hypothetical protein
MNFDLGAASAERYADSNTGGGELSQREEAR